MALSKITYDNKETLVDQPSIANKNKCTASDLNEIKSVVNGAVNSINGDLVVGSVSTKNLFDKNTIVDGDIIGGSPTIRLSSRQLIWLEAGTYTFSCNLTSPLRWAINVQNTATPPLSSYVTYMYDSGWLSASTTSQTFTISSGGWLCLMLSKENNATLTLSEVLGFNYQLEKGDTATTYKPYQNLNNDISSGLLLDGKVKYKKVGNIVIVSCVWWGTLSVTSFGETTLTTLPTTFSPIAETSSAIYCKSTGNVGQNNFYLKIKTDGTISITNGGNTATDLGVITFNASYII